MNWPISDIKPGVVLIVGPTAIGKTDLSIALARRWECAVVSADAFQVYQGFNIGTAKVAPEVLSEIPHFCIDVCHPTARFTVGEFQSIAEAAVQEAKNQGHPIVICGGTGLYVQSLVCDYVFPSAPIDFTLRVALNQALTQVGADGLWQKLAQLDATAAAAIHPNHSSRIIRALEICLTTGKPLSESRSQSAQRTDISIIGLRTDRSTHWQWIRNRVIRMIQDGLIDEVDALRRQFGTDIPAFKAVGYPETVAYLDGMIASQNELIDQIAIRTRQLAKRQLTWFKRLAHVRWIDVS